MPTDTQTNLPIRLESTARSQEAEAWWPQGICRRENYAAVINAVVVRPFGGRGARVAAWWAAECEVPFKEIVVKRCGSVVGAWAGREFGGFTD
jgi:hypothetical protein